ncbi:MAG: ferrochelatase, partial [Cyclobacteriaceae bacterium]
LLVVPMYPQYASATTASTMEKVWEELSKWQIIPTIEIVANFFDDPKFIDVYAALGKRYMKEKEYDHIVFTYHGLPERQILKGSFDNYCKLGECCSSYNSKNKYCYRGQCFENSRLIAKAIGITEDQMTICFQSRLGKTPWIKPYTDHEIERLAKEGKKNILVFSPAFVADCLETTIEVAETYKEQFIEAGGESWQLVEGLNVAPEWVEYLAGMAKKRLD